MQVRIHCFSSLKVHLHSSFITAKRHGRSFQCAALGTHGLLCSQISAQRCARSAVPLKDINVEIKPEDNIQHGHFIGEEAQRLKRQAPRLDDINIKMDAVDNSHHGAGGHGEAERLKRQVESLNAINIGVNAVDNSRHGTGPSSGAGGHQPSGHDEQPEAPSSEKAECLKRQAPRLDDINIKVEREIPVATEASVVMKPSVSSVKPTLNAIAVNAVDDTRHGSDHDAGGAGGGQEQPDGEAAGRFAGGK
ncbi:hypothetical protein AAVH_11997 [Aphelenchoides avenae]|nr:hypothetical protein AAVH_11997 [Aphelenchus avenae]